MKLFLHLASPDKIRIINDALEWSGTLAQFLVLEPGYPGLPSGATVRYQTVDLAYYEDATGRHEDAFNALPYCEGAYLAAVLDPFLTIDRENQRIGIRNTSPQYPLHVENRENPITPVAYFENDELSVSLCTHPYALKSDRYILCGQVYVSTSYLNSTMSILRLRVLSGLYQYTVISIQKNKVEIFPQTDATNVFNIYDSGGSLVFLVDTINNRIRIGGSLECVRGKYCYHRQTPGTDTDGDWRQYADADGFYTQKRESGAWVTKQTIT